MCILSSTIMLFFHKELCLILQSVLLYVVIKKALTYGLPLHLSLCVCDMLGLFVHSGCEIGGMLDVCFYLQLALFRTRMCPPVDGHFMCSIDGCINCWFIT